MIRCGICEAEWRDASHVCDLPEIELLRRKLARAERLSMRFRERASYRARRQVSDDERARHAEALLVAAGSEDRRALAKRIGAQRRELRRFAGTDAAWLRMQAVNANLRAELRWTEAELALVRHYLVRGESERAYLLLGIGE